MQRTTWLTFPRYEPFPEHDKSLMIVLRSYRIPFKSSASNISKVKRQRIACLPTSAASSYMQSGRLCLIKNLLTPTRMVYSLNSLMGSLAGYFLVFLHIQLTTLKSTFIISICCLANTRDLLSRVLLSTIKFLGACPCPTCLVAKDKVRDLGTKHDIRNHRRKMRTDDEFNKKMIERVRTWMYEEGLSINSTAIKRLMDPESLVPTRVSNMFDFTMMFANVNRTHSLSV